MKKIASPIIVVLLLIGMLTFVINIQPSEGHQFAYPKYWWADDFSAGMTNWVMLTGGQGSVVLSNTNYITANYSVRMRSPKSSASWAYAYPLANRTTPGSNAVLSQINYTDKYIVDFYFYLKNSTNHWIHVFTNKHIDSVIDTGTDFKTRSGGVNTLVKTLNTTTWYRIRYWVEPANGTYHIDVYNCAIKKWIVWQVTRNFHGGPWPTTTPFVIGDNEASSANYIGEAYWDNFCIYFNAIPARVTFRLLAVEGVYRFVANETEICPAQDYPMKSAQYLIENLTQFTNWKNVTHGAYTYTSYIHLLSNATVAPALQKYFRGQPTNSSVVSEIQNFLGQTGPNESNDLTIRIFYYCGHSGAAKGQGNPALVNFYLALGKRGNHPGGPSPYEELYANQLNTVLRSGDLNTSRCVLVILDSCNSSGFIGPLHRSGRVILTAVNQTEAAWGWDGFVLPFWWSWFTGHGPAPVFPPNSKPVGIRGAIYVHNKFPSADGWLSAGEAFRYANGSTRAYAGNASIQIRVPITMSPQRYYGVCGGEIPFVMTSPWTWRIKPGTWPPQLEQIPRGFPFNALPVLKIQADLSSPWHNYRSDPSRTGYSTATGPGTSLTLWEKSLVDPIYSSAALADGMAFIATLGGGAGGGIYALDVQTGDVVWAFSTDSPIHSSPAVANGTVFFGTDSGKIYAVEAYTGLVKWVSQITTASIISSPTVVNGKVFLGSSDGNVYALNESIGNLIWNFPTSGPVVSSPAVASKRVFCGSQDGKLYAINETTGSQLWYYQTGAAILSTPAVADGRVFFGSKNNRLYAFSESGTPLWDWPTSGPVVSSPAVDSNKALVIAGSTDGSIHAINEITGLPVWSFVIGDSINMSSPAISGNGLVYVGTTDGIMHCLNETNGDEIWIHFIGGTIDSSPSISDDHVFIGSSNGNMYCFGPGFPIHDIAVTGLTASPTTIFAGISVEINYTVINKGNRPETFNLIIAHNETSAVRTEIVSLAPQESVTNTFTWNTTGLAKGNYTLSAVAQQILGELDLDDNAYFNGWILVTKVGDLGGSLPPQFFQCDGNVDGKDLALFLLCFKGTAPPEAMYLADLGGGVPPQFFDFDGKVDGKDLALFLQCFKGQGPPDP